MTSLPDFRLTSASNCGKLNMEILTGSGCALRVAGWLVLASLPFSSKTPPKNQVCDPRIERAQFLLRPKPECLLESIHSKNEPIRLLKIKVVKSDLPINSLFINDLDEIRRIESRQPTEFKMVIALEPNRLLTPHGLALKSTSDSVSASHDKGRFLGSTGAIDSYCRLSTVDCQTV